MPFTEKLDLKLIKAVRDNPLLYDHNDGQYMDFNEREVVWQKIGDQLKYSASECKSRWINIRDINRRILLRKLKHPEQRGSLYKYDAELSFIRPYYKDAMIQNSVFPECDNSQNACDADGGFDSSDGSSNEKPDFHELRSTARPKKRKRVDDTEKPANMSANISDASISGELDPFDQVDAFLLSIGATLKTFSPYHLNLAKSQIFAVVQEHDLQQIVNKQGQSNSTSDVHSVDSVFKSNM